MDTAKIITSAVVFCSLCFVQFSSSQECTDRITADNPLYANIAGSRQTANGLRATVRNVTLRSCQEVFTKYPALCQSLNIGAQGGSCCASCGDHTCLDKVTKLYPYQTSKSPRGPRKTIYSCKAMASKYTALCREEGRPLGQCCRACKTVENLECVDDFRVPSSAHYRHENFVNCPQYIKADPCRCITPDVKESCCVSCRDIDIDSLNCNCTDIFNPKLRGISLFATIRYYPNITLLNNYRLKSCREIKNWYPHYCTFDHCCESCTGVDPTCTDNLQWRASISNDAGKTCNDCTCHEIRKQGRDLMRQACEYNYLGNNMPFGARIACCRQCGRLGFRKPNGYRPDRRLRHDIAGTL